MGLFGLSRLSKIEKRLLALEQRADDFIAKQAFHLASEALIKIGAIEKSTHTIHPVPVGLGAQEFEKQMQEITGQGREDFESDLRAQGFNVDEQSEDDLV